MGNRKKDKPTLNTPDQGAAKNPGGLDKYFRDTMRVLGAGLEDSQTAPSSPRGSPPLSLIGDITNTTTTTKRTSNRYPKKTNLENATSITIHENQETADNPEKNSLRKRKKDYSIQTLLIIIITTPTVKE
ncbi:Hypothetical predicted protein [Pelobates cultripes]|uniref:Uncharacterized protein n=1 Tax=Pelobates cultripes TaxID=61616 RepID=A0AAD1VPI9_PELCU|nr:Hypothetical predicted protein [Pelobates cultripes]